VSTTPVANCHRYQGHRRQICHRCQRHRWQNMEKISGCRLLKENLKAKIYIYVDSITQRCQNKIIKIFLIEDFSICHRCQRHRWCTLSREYLLLLLNHLPPDTTSGQGLEKNGVFSFNISANFRKIRNDRNDILRCLGKLIYEKNQKSKISWHCPFKLCRKVHMLTFRMFFIYRIETAADIARLYKW
jgi:hypothetical protein